MKTSDFYYDLPQELIAQDPLEDRSSSRLMHLSLKDGSIEHRHFTDVLDYMEEGDCLVINDTKGVGEAAGKHFAGHLAVRGAIAQRSLQHGQLILIGKQGRRTIAGPEPRILDVV